MKNTSAIILAAGRGKRMRSTIPKILHSLCGFPMVSYPLELCLQAGITDIVLVLDRNHQTITNELKKHVPSGFSIAIQDPPMGTADAVQKGFAIVKPNHENVLILCGDMPLFSPVSLRSLFKKHQNNRSDLTLVTALHPNPGHYGRVIRDDRQNPVRIVEARDANTQEKQITEINSGIYLVKRTLLQNALGRIKNKNQQKEYYLTDMVALAHAASARIGAYQVASHHEMMGINTQQELAEAQKKYCQQLTDLHQKNGVQFIFPESIYLEKNVRIASGSQIMGPCYLFGKTHIEKNVTIESGCFIQNCHIQEGSRIKAYSYLSESSIGQAGQIGPFAHLRPGTKLEARVKIGNFVETKKTTIGRESKVNHLSYIGDATIGRKVNIGAGTITCNYDGRNKFQTILEDGVFVGSDTQFVAPVRIGKKAFIGAGSTITKDVAPGALALSRTSQKEMADWGKKKHAYAIQLTVKNKPSAIITKKITSK